MEIKELKSKDLQKEFQVKIPSKDIAQKLNNKLLEISENTEISGFRKGKAPMQILRQKFGQDALGQVLDETIKLTSNEIISKNNFRLAMKPKVDVKKFGEDKGLEYVVSLELIPEIQVQDTKNLKLVKYISLVDETELQKTLDNIVGIRTKNVFASNATGQHGTLGNPVTLKSEVSNRAKLKTSIFLTQVTILY